MDWWGERGKGSLVGGCGGGGGFGGGREGRVVGRKIKPADAHAHADMQPIAGILKQKEKK